MAVSIITLYLAGQQVQVVEGSQYHFIVASMGATAQPPVPGPPTRPDPFPQYVHDDEIADLVADAAVDATDPVVAALLGDGGSQTRAALDALDLAGDPITPEAVEANLPARLGEVELRAAFEAPIAIRSPSPFRLSGANRVDSSSFHWRPIGHDKASGVMWFFRTGSAIFQTDNYGTSFSTGRTLPTDVAASNVNTVVKFGANVYMLAKITSGTQYNVYRAAHVAQGSNWSGWSAPLASLTAGALPISHLSLIATGWGSGDVLVLSDYGDPTAGPTIQVSSDGTTWTTTYGPDATLRHVHHINWDPYRPGHLWAAIGDGTSKTVMRSTDYGQNWAVVAASSSWQGVQVSFTETHVYLAGDSLQATVLRIHKDTLVPEMPALNFHHDVIPPHIGGGGRRITDLVTTTSSTQVTSASGAFTSADRGKYIISPNLPPRSFISGVVNGTTVNLSQTPVVAATAAAQISGDLYFANAFYGEVDPDTGVYYGAAIDNSGPGTTYGVFFLPRTGEMMQILDPGGIGIFPWGPTCMIAGGYLWVGGFKYPLLQVEETAP